MNKSEIRRIQIEKLDKILDKNKQVNLLMDKLFQTERWKKASVVATYVGGEMEVDTNRILFSDKKILLPKINGDTLVFAENTGEFKVNKFGIPEPIGPTFKGDIDLIIVPGVAFTLGGKRLGWVKAITIII